MKRVKIDAPMVTGDEARELMFHHLGMACAYFEAVPEDQEDNRSELHRLFGQEAVGAGDLRFQACDAFLSSLSDSFRQLAARQRCEDGPQHEPEVMSAANRAIGINRAADVARTVQALPLSNLPPVSKTRDALGRAMQGARPLSGQEKIKLAGHGLRGGGIDPVRAGKILGLNIRKQGRGLRVVYDNGL